LISHIRSLALNEIAFKQKQDKKNMSHQDNPMLLIFLKLKHMKNRKTSDTTAQFDQLTTSSSETSFDDLQKDYTPVKQEPAVEVEPLEFNFSFEKLQLPKIQTQQEPEQQHLRIPEFRHLKKQMS
jgi:hypothetical protein